jgi:NAD(P)-dependent dehydrogenase (short-subunit alcohol dehydrogenase family)
VKEVLIVGGTRNLGPGLVAGFLARGHRVAVCNRGVTADDLSLEVERLLAADPARAPGEAASLPRPAAVLA